MQRYLTLLIAIAMVAISIITVPAHSAAADSSARPQLNADYWKAEIFSNPYLIGPVTLERTDSSIAFNWGTGAPASGLAADNFSIRWGSTPYFQAGTYRFSALADDSIAVTIDFHDEIINSLDAPQPGQTFYAEVTLSEGYHHIQVDYQEFGGLAYAYVAWTPLNGNIPQPESPSLPADRPAAYINTGRLNVRNGPGTDHTILGVVTRNSIVTLLQRNSDSSWVRMRRADGLEGWVSSAYVVPNVQISTLPLAGTIVPPQAGRSTGRVWSWALNVRYGPSIDYRVVTTTRSGEQVTLLGRAAEGNWVQVRLANGLTGWVNSNYLITSTPTSALPITWSNGSPIQPAPQTHVVQPGENLFRIALRYGVSWQSLVIANGLVNANQIYAGQVLTIPSA